MKHPLARDLDHILEHTRDVWKTLAGQRIFITGGTGFVGTWLLDSLVWANERLNASVSAVVLTRDPDAFQRKVPEIAAHPSLTYLLGNASSFPDPNGGFPFVVHGSTEKQFAPNPKNPTGLFDQEVAATRRVLEFARTHGTERFLYVSSGSVYGTQPSELTHIPEDYAGAPSTVNVGTAYGQAKRAGEWLTFMCARQYGFTGLIARLFAFLGPRLPLNRNFAAGNFVRDVLNGGPVGISGDGSPLRSYLYAADLAIWLWTVLARGEAGRPYNVGSPDAISISTLARTIVEEIAPDTPIEVAKQPIPDAPPARYVPSIARAAVELNLQTWVSLQEAARRTYEWNRYLTMNLSEAIATIEAALPEPEDGYPRSIFDFLGRNVPLTNVDLLIQDDLGRTLLTWRADERYGPGWHLPGGVIRFKQLAAERVREVAQAEVGASVDFEPEPIYILEAISSQKARGHSIALLYRCRLIGEPGKHLQARDPIQSGQWSWHERCPADLIPEQKGYARFF